MTTVLVVDDEAPIRLLCRVNLEAEGMTVLEAADGEKGLELARAERPDVVLLDVMMPGRSGWEVAEELLADEATSGIIRYLRTNDSGSGFTTPYPRTTPAGGGGGPTGCIDPALT